jgi:hypothetical protein
MLTDEQKNQIVFSLCYPNGTLDITSVNYNSVVASRINNLNEFAEELALALKAKLDALKAKLDSSSTSNSQVLQERLKRIGDIEFYSQKEANLSGSGASPNQKDYNRLLNELANLLGIPNMCSGSGCKVRCLWA